MSTQFITQDIWPQLTKAVRASKQRSAVAVAYFGAGASDLLPLAKGSRLVVDASERAVASGQTCPADIIKLVKRGVRVYSVPNLHAKVFVLGRAAFIGSANVSNRSASQLVEAVVRTTERATVSDARQFVLDHCLHELTPALLKRLSKLYRPPLVPGGKRRRRQSEDHDARQPTLPRLLLAQLELETWTDSEQKQHEAGRKEARTKQKHPRLFKLESFRYTGRCPYQRGDVVVQVTNEGGGNVLASPAGTVLHVRTRKTTKGQVSFVYLECPARRRRSIRALAAAIGRGALTRLKHDGLVRDKIFARALLNQWAE